MAGFDSPNDSVGTPITLGATVKLVCTVTAINLFDNRFNDITVTINNKITGNPGVDATGGDDTVPGYRTTLTFPPSILTVGS